MKPVLIAILLMASLKITAGIAPEKLLLTSLNGPVVAFEGRQHSVVNMDNGQAVGDVKVQANGKGSVRREYLTGPAKGVVWLQTKSAVWQRAGSGPWTHLPSIVDPQSLTVAQMMHNYKLTFSHAEIMLGRKAIPVMITPRQTYNPSRRLWLEPETGIILKDQFFAPDGRVRSSSVYMSLSQAVQPANLFKVPREATEPDLFGPASFSPRGSPAEVERESGRPVLLPAHVPSGFRPVLYGIMHTGSGRKMPAVRYSDGLAAFTLFQRGWGAGNGAGRRGRGPGGGNCVGQSGLQQSVVTISGQRSNYILMGDIAMAELERIARSLP